MAKSRWHNKAATLLLLVAPAVSSPVARAGQQTGKSDPAAQALSQGSVAMQAGDLPAAQTAFQHALTLAPRSAEAHFGLGLVQLRTGAPEAAMASLKQAASLDPKLGGTHLFLGIAQYQNGQPEAALANVRAELGLSPDNVEALTWFGIIALGGDHPEQAVAPLDRAVALKPNDPMLLYYDGRAHSQVAAAVMSKLYALDPDSVLVHRALAESYAESNQPEKSIAEYNTALTRQPGNSELLEALGEQQQKLSRFEDAQKTYTADLAINPSSPGALYNLGKMRVEHGHPQEGVDLLRKAIAAHVRPAPADFYLGYGLAQLGQNDEAAHWLERSLADGPSPFIEASADFQLARVYQHLGRKQEAQRLLAHLQQLKASGAVSSGETEATAGPAAPSVAPGQP